MGELIVSIEDFILKSSKFFFEMVVAPFGALVAFVGFWVFVLLYSQYTKKMPPENISLTGF